MAIAWPRDLSCHARLGSQVLGGSREALRRGGATAGYASQPRRCEGAGAQCAGRLGPKNGAKWTDWKTRSDLGEEILFGDAVFHGDIC